MVDNLLGGVDLVKTDKVPKLELGAIETNGQLVTTGLGESMGILQLRREAWERYKASSIPSMMDEAWRFTPGELFLSDAMRNKLHTIYDANESVLIPSILTSSIPVISDLMCSCKEDHSVANMPKGIDLRLICDAISTEDAFAESIFSDPRPKDKFDHLINSLFTDGVVFKASKNIKVSSPVGIHSPIPAGQVKVGRSFLQLEEGSESDCIFWIDGGSDDAYYFGWVTVDVLPNAHMKLTVFQMADETSSILWRLRGRVYQDASLIINVINFGGRVVRNELNAEVLGKGATAQLFGLTLGSGNQHFAIHTLQKHASARATTRLRFKQVFTHQSKGVFDGLIYVPPGAPGTDAYQENHNLILSKDAKVNSIPRLEINTDDVRCTHGATVKYVLPNEVFYLRSRGLRESVAKHLLVSSFLEEMTSKITVESIRDYAERVLEDKVRGGIS